MRCAAAREGSSTTGTSSASPSGSPRGGRAHRLRLVLLDANILFLPVRAGFPLEAEIERARPGATPVVPDSVLGELDQLVARGTPDASAARRFAERFPRVPSTGRGDDAILRLAVRRHATVATADRELRDRLNVQGVAVLSPRDRHRLELTEGRALARVRRGSGAANR